MMEALRRNILEVVLLEWAPGAVGAALMRWRELNPPFVPNLIQGLPLK